MSPGFFEAMGIQLRSGRVFTEDDRQTTAQVAIVNETFVRRCCVRPRSVDDRDLFRIPNDCSSNEARHRRRRPGRQIRVALEQPEPAFYVVPDQIGQLPGAFSFSVIVSTRLADPAALVPAIRAAVRDTDPLSPSRPKTCQHWLPRRSRGSDWA